MLRVSDLLLLHKEINTFEELVELVRRSARTERFFRIDLKPPFPDTPENWEMVLEATFSGYTDYANE